jgi:hypothetical protein
MRPIIFDGTTRLANVFEVSSAKVLMLLHVKPEIQNIFCCFPLQKETDPDK